MLIIFSGLPATGKSTLARLTAQEFRAVWLRIDSIEQAIADAGLGAAGPAGYMAAYALAETNLRLGHTVIADSVNPIAITRSAWQEVAAQAGVGYLDVEVICSNAAEHRRRAEARASEVPGLILPTWAQIEGRNYEPWNSERVVIDTARQSADEAQAQLARNIRMWRTARGISSLGSFQG